ncbi:MAG TPA: hypothetical protein PKC24_03250 [Cyclobacteriaceae bacterium]|nr:hypothetical protein [Cyclobacteriaceae bacterium]
MEKQNNLYKSLSGVALATVILLLVPLFAMQFTTEVNWSAGDFIIMGLLLFGTGTAMVVLTQLSKNIVYRIAMILAVGSTFLMIWANLAVGLIGAGPHAGNLMYMGVILVFIAGLYLSHFKARGLELAMYATVLSLVLLTAIAILANMQNYPGSSVQEIIAVNGFFIMPYLTSGLLFRHVTQQAAST